MIDSFIAVCLLTLLLTNFKDTFPLELFVLFPNCHLGCLVLTLRLKLVQTVHLSTESLTLLLMHQLAVATEWKTVKGHLLGFVS